MSFRTQQQSSALAPIVFRLYAACFKDAADTLQEAIALCLAQA